MDGKWFANRGQIFQTIAGVMSAGVGSVALYFVLKSNNSLPKASAVMYVSGGILLLVIGIIIGRRLGSVRPAPSDSISRKEPIQPLRIKSAKYGVSRDRYKDVTDQVRAQVKNNKLNFLVSNVTLLGLADPFYGEVKYLFVDYSFGDGPISEIVRREQDLLEIPEENDNRMANSKVTGSKDIETIDPVGQNADDSLEQRAFETAKNVRKRWAEFKKRNGDKPDYVGPTLGQAQSEASAEYLKQSMAWQDRARGWYEGKAKEGLVKIRSELAEHGLTDQDLDDNIGLRFPTEESIQLICERLRWLACQLDD